MCRHVLMDVLVFASCEVSETPKEAAHRFCYSLNSRDRMSLSSPSVTLNGRCLAESALNPGNPAFLPKLMEESIDVWLVSLDAHG